MLLCVQIVISTTLDFQAGRKTIQLLLPSDNIVLLIYYFCPYLIR